MKDPPAGGRGIFLRERVSDQSASAAVMMAME